MSEEFALTSPASAWPLLFKFRAPVMGNGFVAVVHLHGRLLARPGEGGRVWLDGVNPGALAVDAPSLERANLELHSALTAVFADFAEQAPKFNDFKVAVEKFFHDTDGDSVAEWLESVKAVQQGKIAAPEGLPRYSADLPLTVEVTCKSTENVTPKDNPVPEPELAAAA